MAIYTWVVIVAVIGELFSDAVIWVSSDALQSISDGEILALNKEIAPRRLLPSEQEEITKALIAFRGKNIRLESYVLDVEGAVLGRQIKDAIFAAHIGFSDALMTRGSSGSIALGVHVTGV